MQNAVNGIHASIMDEAALFSTRENVTAVDRLQDGEFRWGT